jgi:hypothetical protein
MSVVRPVPRFGSVHPDARGDGRALRVSWHPAADDGRATVVLSIWRDNVCTGTVRIAAEQLPALLASLQALPVTDAPHGQAERSLPA